MCARRAHERIAAEYERISGTAEAPTLRIVAGCASPVRSWRRDPLEADIAGEQRAETILPLPHSLMADIDTAFEEQVFDISQRQREPHIHQHYEAGLPRVTN